MAKKTKKTPKKNGHGGARPGAGRPSSLPVFDEPTIKRDVPVRLESNFQNWIRDHMVKK